MRLTLAILAVAVSSSARATDLVNKDSVTYAARISSGAAATKVTVAAKSVKLAVCPSTAAICIVSVEGVGEIEVTGADDVIIENGRLTKK